MAVNDVYQLNVTHVLNTREISNVFYYYETVVAFPTAETVATAISREWYLVVWIPWWRRVVSNECVLTSIWARRMWPTEDPASTLFFTGDVGAVVDQSIPNGSAVLISMRDVSGLARFRRRSYISGLTEGHSAGSRIIPAQVADWEDLADALTATTIVPPGLGGGQFAPAAYTKKFSAPPPAIPFSQLAFNKLTRYLRSQRGRNPRRT